ncbi:MAG TPA: cystathionine gamma-lyase [Vicinamibacterales bacterium]|nr:cystathionine gamma-lyase [Vicinamibacterales bacterium]
MTRETEIVHAGYRHSATGAWMEGPQFSATYMTPGEPASHPLTYGRFQNPTWSAFEEALTLLEGGEAIVFSSGMAAIDALFGVTLKPGDVVVLPSDSYYTTRVVGANWWHALGIEVRQAPTRDDAQAAALEGATLLLIETPTNPQLDVCDIASLARAAKSKGALVAVDNTTATPYLQQPLALGADFVVASDTKALTGHSDVVIGHAAAADSQHAGLLRTWRTQHGAIPGPMEVWLAHRSLATLPLRLGRQCESAQQFAEFLRRERAVVAVWYPGLGDHPGHQTAARQMRAFGSVVSFDLGSRARAEEFFRALTLVKEATSFGGVHSSAERRARWGGDAIGEGFIRFSVGCESIEDIIADVRVGLRAAAAA